MGWARGALACHGSEHAMSPSSQTEHKSGKDIRLTEYAACAG
jgi:hypothetical protein